MKTLISMPDAKQYAPKIFKVGESYKIIGELCNCYKVEVPGEPAGVLVLKSRFQ